MENKLPKPGDKFRLKNFVVNIINIEDGGFNYRQLDGTTEWESFEDFYPFYEPLPEEAISKMETTEKFPAGIYFYPDLKEGEDPVKEPEQKLPVEGKRYYRKHPNATPSSYIFNRIEDDKIWVDPANYSCLLSNFWNDWQEFPYVEDHKEEEKPTPYIDSLHSAVDKALEDEKSWYHPFYALKAELAINRSCHFTRIEKLEDLGSRLVNALEEEKKRKSGIKKCRACGDELLIADRFSFLWNGEEYCSRECAEIKAKREIVDDRTIPQTPVSGISDYAKEKIKRARQYLYPNRFDAGIEELREAMELIIEVLEEKFK